MLIFFLISYFFTLVFYFNFYYDIDPICSTLSKCYLMVIDSTFKNNAGKLINNLFHKLINKLFHILIFKLLS